MKEPRRFSADKNDPGYKGFSALSVGEQGSEWTVLVDGREIRDVVTADIDAGYVIVQLRDKDGKKYVAGDGRAAIEIIRGRVQVFVFGVEL